MSSNEYFLAWTIYMVSSFFVVMFWCWVTSPLKSLVVRLLLRLPIVAILLTPIPHIADPSLYVPVVAAVAFDFIGKNPEALSADVMTLLAAIIVSLIIAVVVGLLGKLIARLLASKSTT
jgi:hypothetical protein